MVFGPMLTLVAAFLSWKLTFGKKIVACIYPVLINAFGVSAYIYSFYDIPYILSVTIIAFGEFIAVFMIGYLLLMSIEKTIKKNENARASFFRSFHHIVDIFHYYEAIRTHEVYDF